MAADKREAGLDLLRMVSMLFIVVLHLLGQGGVLRNAAPFSWGFYGAWLMEAFALCAVNCYGLLSGYFGVTARFSYRKYLPHWLQVFFYSLGFALLFAALSPSGWNPRALLSACLPVLTSEYWYFTAYTVVFFLMPFLNLVVNNVDERGAKRLCWTLAILFSLLPTLVFKDPFLLKFGYSALWLVALYLIGGCIRRFGVPKLLPGWGYAGVYAGSTLAAWGGMVIYAGKVFGDTGALPPGDPFLQYVSPLILLASLALFLAFRQLKVGSRRAAAVIRFLAPVSFGVYLIHTNPYLFNGPLKDCLRPFLTLPAPAYLAVTALTALGIYLACSLIDAVRLRLFNLVAGAVSKRKGT
ncbi:MAG: hypothetical protein EOM52_02080 [Clostridia bacterium]|nr:hypothetical protein [Clostridia bacterium]